MMSEERFGRLGYGSGSCLIYNGCRDLVDGEYIPLRTIELQTFTEQGEKYICAVCLLSISDK